jgi:hypothetical protein
MSYVPFQIRKDTAANWTANNPTLAIGELGYEIDTRRLKIGDDVTAWISLVYFMGNGVNVQTAGNAVATITPVSKDDMIVLTALSVPITSIVNPATPVWEGKKLMMRIKDNGVARAISGWGAQYRAVGPALPTTTIAGKTLYLGFIYNLTDAKWDLIAYSQET